MNRLRLWMRNLFGLSRTEANGVLVLLPLMILILFSYPAYRWLRPSMPIVMERDTKYDSILSLQDQIHEEILPESQIIYFQFDPNEATDDEFKQLGFPRHLVQRIINYRNAGGNFKKKEDLLKIYGMDASLYFNIAPYVHIIEVKKVETPPKITQSSRTAPSPIDLNAADTTQLKLIKGIGTIFATRITKYRSSLGGFVDEMQLKEVYGLDSITLQNAYQIVFVDDQFTPKQIDINIANEKDLSTHPYISSKLAKSIITYRFQHGSFNEIDDLLKLELIDSIKLQQIRPYLKIVR